MRNILKYLEIFQAGLLLQQEDLPAKLADEIHGSQSGAAIRLVAQISKMRG